MAFSILSCRWIVFLFKQKTAYELGISDWSSDVCSSDLLASDLAGRPEAANLVGIYGALTGRATDSICAEYAGQGFGAFKPALAELLIESLRPIRQRFQELKSDSTQLDALLEKGAEKARSAAAPTLAGAYDALGLMA